MKTDKLQRIEKAMQDKRMMTHFVGDDCLPDGHHMELMERCVLDHE